MDFIWSTGQQEPDKESGTSVDEVAKQLDRQVLEDKERDDDDEGKWLIWSLCVFICLCNLFCDISLVNSSINVTDQKEKVFIGSSLKNWICWIAAQIAHISTFRRYLVENQVVGEY